MVTIDLDVADELIVPGDAKKDTAAGAPGKVNKGKPAAGKADKKKEKEEVKGEEKKEKEQKKKVEKEASVEKKVVEKEVKAVEAAPEAAIGDLPPGEPERLDLRVGKVLSVQRHAQADTLYVEEIDVGEDKPRTVVSGLVKYMKESDLLNRSVVLLCNLKPQKMRGIESQAMVLASTSVDGTTVELLDAPKGSAPGDRCWFDTHVGTDFSQLNPKKKVWEGVQPRLKTDSAKRAVYVVNEGGFKTVNVLRTAKGDVTVKTIVGGSIK
ncbi:hypothetical protein BC829DRAFT_369003 [Chytridium lagenaria]|nr:hypothetical protein BC829DRAFT_369003 [Chytridium lagenaria]